MTIRDPQALADSATKLHKASRSILQHRVVDAEWWRKEFNDLLKTTSRWPGSRGNTAGKISKLTEAIASLAKSLAEYPSAGRSDFRERIESLIDQLVDELESRIALMITPIHLNVIPHEPKLKPPRAKRS